MSWLRLSVDCDAGYVEAVADLLDRLGAESVSVSSGDWEISLDMNMPERQQYWTHSLVSALLPPELDLDILIACLRNRIGGEHVRNPSITAVEDRDWVGESQRAHGAMLFGDRLCVCPTWSRPLPAAHTLIIDPGLAFGTGAHQTTALCLEWLCLQKIEGAGVIDYGCGTGILGMAAARLGARSVQAVDNDARALAAARENLCRNGLEQCVSLHLNGDTLEPAEVLVANILLDPLQQLASRFAELVVPGGGLAISGLLAVQVEDCLDAYRPWFNMNPPEFREEWVLLHGARRR